VSTFGQPYQPYEAASAPVSATPQAQQYRQQAGMAPAGGIPPAENMAMPGGNMAGQMGGGAQTATYGEGWQQTGLPQTGLDAQLATLRARYAQVAGGVPGQSSYLTGRTQPVTYDYVGDQARAASQNAFLQQRAFEGDEQGRGGSSLNNMAQSLARNYGLPVGRGAQLVDENGNWLYTPQQIAEMSQGKETIGTAAAKMQYIENALTEETNRDQQARGRSAIVAGMQQLQGRSRGSLAQMQSGFYQDLASLYSNEQYTSEDFSYWIQREQELIQQEQARRLRKQQRKQGAIMAGVGVVLLVASVAAGPAGLATGGLGVAQIAQGGSQAGWW
jgi:hypothetical protein